MVWPPETGIPERPLSPYAGACSPAVGFRHEALLPLAALGDEYGSTAERE
jgi:hypothetical protein